MMSTKICAAAQPFLRELHDRSGETVGLAVLDPKVHKGLIIGAFQGLRHRISFTLVPGTWFPLHTGAPAKAILAFLPPAQQRLWLAHLVLTRFTPQTITTRAAFRKELSAVAAQGYALDRSEEVEGCHCVAAPVFNAKGHAVAAIWITGPSSRLSLADLHKNAPTVCESASRIAAALASAATAPAPSGHALLVQRILLHLHAHLSETVDWQALSAELGVSYSKLRHVFAERAGQPPSQYHLGLRLQEARRLLKETALPIHAVAAKTGFSDANHFSALFARKTGLSPTRLRTRLRSECCR